MPWYYGFGISRRPTSTARNTITLASAGIVGLTIAIATAGQTAWRVEDYNGKTASQCTASGCQIYGELSLSGSSTRTAQIRDVDYLFPSAACANGQVWKQDGSGNISCANDNTGGAGGGTGVSTETGNVLSLSYYQTATSVSGTHFYMTDLNTMSGNALHLSRILSLSGTLTVDGMAYLQGGATGNLTGNADTATALAANGANCPAGQYPLGVDASGAVEGCTADQTGAAGSFGTGNVLTLGDNRYVNQSGDTMTGDLILQGKNLYGSGVYVDGTMSGWNIHANTLSASGTTSIDGMIYAQGGVTGNLTGNADTATALAANGANCSAGQYPLGVDASGAVEDCTADLDTVFTLTGALQARFDNRYVNTSGDTMTGNLVLQSANLTALGIYTTGSLSASGVLSVDGAAFFATNITQNTGTSALQALTVATTLAVTGAATFSDNITVAKTGSIAHLYSSTQSGAGLADCDNAGEKCVWDVTTEMWSVGVDDDDPEAGDVAWTDLTDDGTFNDASFCTYDAAGTRIDCNTAASAGTDITADLEEETHCSEHASADLSCGGETLILANASIDPANMAGDDFGEFTCSAGSPCTIDSGVVDSDNIVNDTITAVDIASGAIRGSGALVWGVGSGTVLVNTSLTFEAMETLELRDVFLYAKEAPTGAALIVDINEGGTTVFSTRPQINASANADSGNHVFSDTTIAKGSLVTVDIDQVGSTFAGERITIQLMYSTAKQS